MGAFTHLRQAAHGAVRTVTSAARWATGHGSFDQVVRSAKQTYGSIWAAGTSLGAYNSTNPRRKLLELFRAARGGHNALLGPSLPELIAQGRHLDRTTPTIRGIIEGRKAELVGTGIDAEPTTATPALNALIRAQWKAEAQHLGVNGESLWTLQRMACGELDVAGTFIFRFLVLPERIDEGLIPLAILALEAEWLSPTPVSPIAEGHAFVTPGVEIDPLGRATHYHLRNPDSLMSAGERVPAADLVVGFERRRPRQAFGEPRLVTLIERAMQDDQLVLSELKSANNGSSFAVVVTSDELAKQARMQEGRGEDDLPDQVPMGSISYFGSAEKIESFGLDRPSQSVREFRGTIHGDMAGGAQVSRVWINRDGQAYNFANSKFDQIRTQQMVKPAHDWFGHLVVSEIYRRVLPWILLRNGMPWPKDPAKRRALLAHRLVPDVPAELDDKAAAQGFTAAYQAGIASKAGYLESKGQDPEEVRRARDRELAQDATDAAARIAALQAQCDELNARTPTLKLHWSHLVGQVLGQTNAGAAGIVQATIAANAGAAGIVQATIAANAGDGPSPDTSTAPDPEAP